MAVRLLGWGALAVLAAFLLDDVLALQADRAEAAGATARAWAQAGLYAAALLLAVTHVLRRPGRRLRSERDRVIGVNSFLIRAAFWAVLLIGLVDMGVAFLLGEGLLEDLGGAGLAQALARAEVRGIYVHMPLAAAAVAIAARTRALGVVWLALLIVAAELLIVMFRFIFSYEQLFMTDLVRFWYAALFLLGCAYTLRREGHVRVDVFYAGFNARRKALVNAVGALLLGMPFCWLILIVGLSDRTGIVNSAVLTFEIEGLGDGLYILYLMSVLLAVFAITLLIEFVAVLFDAAADLTREPGGSEPQLAS